MGIIVLYFCLHKVFPFTIAYFLSTSFRILTALVSKMRHIYSSVTLTRNNVTYRGETEINRVLRTSRDPALLLWAWEAWHDALGPPIRPLFTQVARVSNAAARRGGELC